MLRYLRTKRQLYNIINYERKPVIICFISYFDNHSQYILPVITNLESQYYQGIAVVLVDVDRSRKLAKLLNVDQVPKFLVFQNGRLIDEFYVLSTGELSRRMQEIYYRGIKNDYGYENSEHAGCDAYNRGYDGYSQHEEYNGYNGHVGQMGYGENDTYDRYGEYGRHGRYREYSGYRGYGGYDNGYDNLYDSGGDDDYNNNYNDSYQGGGGYHRNMYNDYY